MFPVFHLARSTWFATKTFVAGWRNAARWLVDLARARANLLRDKLQVWWKTSQQNQNLLLKVDPGSTFRNNFLQPATNVFVGATSWSPKVKKRETSTKTCNATMLRDKLRVFVSRISPPLRSCNISDSIPLISCMLGPAKSYHFWGKWRATKLAKPRVGDNIKLKARYRRRKSKNDDSVRLEFDISILHELGD